MEQETRCGWCLINEPMIQYHDSEWGVPSHDDGKHFEFMLMEVMQCGLNWNMMIQKREIFRKCFCDYDFKRIAEFGEEEIAEILLVPGMIRARRKIMAVIHNARQFMKVEEEFGSFDRYLWGFTDYKTYVYRRHQEGEAEARNELSDQVSADLKKRGFKYMGSITVFSHLQACGIINDHHPDCFRYEALLKETEWEYQ